MPTLIIICNLFRKLRQHHLGKTCFVFFFVIQIDTEQSETSLYQSLTDNIQLIQCVFRILRQSIPNMYKSSKQKKNLSEMLVSVLKNYHVFHCWAIYFPFKFLLIPRWNITLPHIVKCYFIFTINMSKVWKCHKLVSPIPQSLNYLQLEKFVEY